MCHKVYGNGASDGYSSISNISEEQVMPAEGVQPHSNSTEKVLSGSVFTGNDLWDGIIRDCYVHPSTPCFQKKVHSFLDKVLETRDLNITGRLSFLRNKVRFADVTNVSHGDGHANDFDTEALNESRSESAIEEVTSSLHGKAVKFMMTHDVELRLPSFLFDDAVLRISPRSLEGNGALVKVEFVPKQVAEARDESRIFKKKILKIFKNKLLLSFLALVLIIKIIKIKLFWLLPIIVGVGTAKKLLLKFLLFLFPALSHLFKLCPSWQEVKVETTKFHHHHHQINHHHTVHPPWYKESHAASVYLPNGPELIFTEPPKGNPGDYLHRAPHKHYGPPPHAIKHVEPVYTQHISTGWENSGPGLGPEYITDVHRNAYADGDGVGLKLNEVSGTSNFAMETPLRVQDSSFVTKKVDPFSQVYASSQKQYAINPVNTVPQRDPASVEKDIQRTQAIVKESLRIQAEQKLIEEQQKILQQQPFVRNPEQIRTKVYDPFYSPIIEKMDKIFATFGSLDDYCKERLVCSMYKTPMRYSPQSNFISAELSRDSSDLEKPTSTNDAAFRFYRYVQAARDGQEQRECARIYSQCLIPID